MVARGSSPLLFAAIAATLGCGRVGFERLSDLDAALPDAAPPDSAPDTRLSCERPADNSALALYTFNQDLGAIIGDESGNHPGDVIGTLSYVEGPRPGCGAAVEFPGIDQDYAVISDDAAWQLSEGSVDFWLLARSYPTALAGMVTRDASGTATAGHLGIYMDSLGRVGARLQELAAPQTFSGGVCSGAGAIVLGQWNHLGLNFGDAGSELWLNGIRVDEPGMLSTVICQTGIGIGIAGNVNPWTLGVNSGGSMDGSALPVSQPFHGALDHLRISAQRRDFSTPAYAKPTP